MFPIVNKLTLNSGEQDGENECHKAVHFWQEPFRFFSKLVCNSVTDHTLLKLRSIIVIFYFVVLIVFTDAPLYDLLSELYVSKFLILWDVCGLNCC